MRRLLVLALLLCALPSVVGAQVNYYSPSGSGGETVQFVANTNVSITTTGTAEEVLATITIPANSFPTSYSGVIVRAVYRHAANTNNASARIRVGGIGGSLVINRASTTSNEWIVAEVQLRVISGTSVISADMFRTSSAVIGSGAVGEVAGLTFTNAIDIVLNGLTATAAGDIILRQYSVSFIK